MSSTPYGRTVVFQDERSSSVASWSSQPSYNSSNSASTTSTRYRDPDSAGHFVDVTKLRGANVVIVNHNKRLVPSTGEPQPPLDSGYYVKDRR